MPVYPSPPLQPKKGNKTWIEKKKKGALYWHNIFWSEWIKREPCKNIIKILVMCLKYMQI